MIFAGADWLAEMLAARNRPPMSPLGKDVANLLGQLYFGIYHIDKQVMKTIWDPNDYIELVVRDSNFATFDPNMLTRLVVLCHDKAIRCEISSRGFGYLMLRFHRRNREGSFSQRHPTIERAILGTRQHQDD
jgi:hypothetical protein